MILLQMHSNDQKVVITRESIHGIIHHSLSAMYHKNGVGQFKNGDPIKVHTFWITCCEYEVNEPFVLELRALGSIEQELNNTLKGKKNIVINHTTVTIDLCKRFPVKIDEVLETRMPIIVRKSIKNLAFDTYRTSNQKTIFLTYLDNPTAWLEAVKDNLFRRAEAVMDKKWIKKAGAPKIRVIRASDARSVLRGMVVRGTRGVLEISSPWNEIAYNIGLGERSSYGYGVLIGEGYD